MSATMIRLKDSVIEKIRKSQPIRNRLMYDLNKSYPTIQRYLDNNSEQLTTASALKIISEETGIEQSELLTK